MPFSQDTVLTIGVVVYALALGLGLWLHHRDGFSESARVALKWLGGWLGWILGVAIIILLAFAGLSSDWLVVGILWLTLPTVLKWFAGSPEEKACVNLPESKPRKRKKPSGVR